MDQALRTPPEHPNHSSKIIFLVEFVPFAFEMNSCLRSPFINEHNPIVDQTGEYSPFVREHILYILWKIGFHLNATVYLVI